MAESATDPKSLNQCSHPGCKCRVQPGTEFCSDYCAQAGRGSPEERAGGNAQAHKCDCGHPACQ